MGIKYFCRISLEIAKTEFKLKTESSYLGILWYLINPILTFVLLFLIFQDRLGTKIELYPAYLILGVVIFNFFQQSTIEATKAIKNNKGLIKSIRFPQESLIAGIIIKNIYSNLLESILILGVMFYLGIPLYMIFIYIPILLILSIFTYGVSLVLSSIGAYFTDLENIWAFLVRLIWLGTPIFYEIAGQTKLFYINLFNPLYFFINISRDLIIYNKLPEIWFILLSLIYASAALLIGILIFNKLKNNFAEMV